MLARTLAYLAACTVAALVLAMEIAVQAATTVSVAECGRVVASAFPLVLYVMPVICALALPGALAAIMYAERRQIRSPFYYGAAGIFAAIIGIAIVNLIAIIVRGISGSQSRPDVVGFLLYALPLYALPGLAGGLSYWSVMNRKGSQT